MQPLTPQQMVEKLNEQKTIIDQQLGIIDEINKERYRLLTTCGKPNDRPPLMLSKSKLVGDFTIGKIELVAGGKTSKEALANMGALIKLTNKLEIDNKQKK